MIIPLAWDSEFFGYPVGSIEIRQTTDWEKFKEDADNFRLVYVFADQVLDKVPPFLQMVDVKVTWAKSLTENQFLPAVSLPANYSVYQGEITEALQELTLLSGGYSRFKLDTHFQNHEFQRIYMSWIEKALHLNQVFVVSDGSEPVGFITLETENKTAQVGLIAVSPKAARRGLGKALVTHAVHEAINSGCSQLLIQTQKRNIPAMKLYGSLGFEVTKEKWIYHYWR